MFGAKYFTTNKFTARFAEQSEQLSQCSDRVWCEQEGYVWYVKHRTNPTADVDMKEFMWIKLQAKDLS